MIEVADDDRVWWSLDEDDTNYEEPLTGVTLLFWSDNMGESYYGCIDEDNNVWLFNVEVHDVEVSEWSEVDLDDAY